MPKIKQKDKPKQLDLFTSSDAPVLKITPVPFKFALDENRFYIEVHQGKLIYTFPLQFTLEEVSHFARELKGFKLWLDEEGMPTELEEIQSWMEFEYNQRFVQR